MKYRDQGLPKRVIKKVCFVIKDQRAYKVTVEVSETRGESILVSAGLQEGDHVVVEGVSRLKEGIEVDVLRSEGSEQKQPVGQ